MTGFISKLFKNRRLWSIVFVAIVLFAAIPNVASADFTLFSLDDLTQKFVSGFFFLVSWVLSLIAGLIIAIQTWFLNVILAISFNLVNSTPVKIGFPIVLSIANLFFVGGLIAIAIATITRQVEYSAKKILWKLVVMAVMVNFGLVICGLLLNISDETTKFFIGSINNEQPSANGDVDYFKFADSIAGAFNPTGAMGPTVSEITRNPAVATKDYGFFASGGDDLGKTIKPIVGLLFTLGTFVIIIITLGTLNAMLLWRYIRLGMALILLPIAWAAWIFPSYQGYYKKWWTKFTQWAIFPPVVVFFIWLGLKISEVMSQRAGEYAPLYTSSTGNVLSEFLGSLIMPIITSALQSFILFGIMMGGMVAAQELGVKFADAGYKAIEGAGNGAKNWANRKFERPKAAAQRGAMRTGGRLASWAEGKNIPFMNKKWGLNDKGKLTRVEKAPQEKLSSVLSTQADNNRDAMEERLNGPGGSLKQRWHEPLDAWQARLRKRGLAPKGSEEEREAEWEKRFNEGAAKAVEENPGLEKNDNETDQNWKARILAARPELKRKQGVPGGIESPDEWKKRVNDTIEELVKKAEGKGGHGDKNKSLLGSIWGGAMGGFGHGGHKHLTPADVKKALAALGLEAPHEEHPAAHPPAQSGGGGGGGGGDSHGHPAH